MIRGSQVKQYQNVENRRHDQARSAATGNKAFEDLLPSFTTAYERSLFNPLVERQQALGGGCKATLKRIAEKLLFILMYCKCYPTFDLLGVLFNFNRSCAYG